MKELFLGILAAALLAAAFQVGRVQAPERPAPVLTPQPTSVKFDAGREATVSFYNPDGRLLKYYEVRGQVERLPDGETIFETADGKRVRTNAFYILESAGAGQSVPATAAATSGDFQ